MKLPNILFLSLILSLLSGNAIAETDEQSTASAIFAGGCFWCVEADFEKLDGVIEAISGYTGGDAETASYKTVTYEKTGHLEAVKVIYDENKISFEELVNFFWKSIDPTDDQGQFCDKGHSYLSAIYYQNQAEKLIIDESLDQLNNNKPFTDEIVTPVLERSPFFDAEDYHQDYYKKNPVRYNWYRRGCGRDQRLVELWGKN